MAQFIVRVLLPNGEKTVIKSKASSQLGDVREQVWQKKQAAFDGYKEGSIFQLSNGEIIFPDHTALSYVAELSSVFWEVPPKSASIVDLFLCPRSDQADREKRQFRKCKPSLPVFKQGYLLKQGGGKVGDMMWKKRYCVLQSQTLFWYDDEDTCLESRPANNCVKMGSVYATAHEESKRQYSFRLSAGHIFKRDFSLAATSQHDLDEWLESIEKTFIRRTKSVLVTIGEALMTHGLLENEGLFRVSGKKDTVDQLMKKFDEGEFPYIDDFNKDCHVLSGVFKQVLRSMPEPLLTFERYQNFISLGKKEMTSRQAIDKLAEQISQLPFTNQALLKYLMFFLSEVSKKSNVNKMSTQNLAIVVAPNILRTKDPGASQLLDNELVLKCIDRMIVHGKEIFDILETSYWPDAAAARGSSPSISALTSGSFSPPSSPNLKPMGGGASPSALPTRSKTGGGRRLKPHENRTGGASFANRNNLFRGSQASSPGFRGSRATTSKRTPIRSKTTIPTRSSQSIAHKQRSKSPPPKPSNTSSPSGRSRVPRRPTVQKHAPGASFSSSSRGTLSPSNRRILGEVDKLNTQYETLIKSWSNVESQLNNNGVLDNQQSELNKHLTGINKSLSEAINSYKALQSFLDTSNHQTSTPTSPKSIFKKQMNGTTPNGVSNHSPSYGIQRSSTLPPRQSTARIKKTNTSLRSGPSSRPSNASVARRALSPGGRKKRTAKALFDYKGGVRQDGELLFSENDIIEIIDHPDTKGGWWYGKKAFKEGWFPEKYVKLQ